LPIAGAFRPFGACNLAGKILIGTALAGTLFSHFSLALAVPSYFLLLTPHLYWLFTSHFLPHTSHLASTHQLSLLGQTSQASTENTMQKTITAYAALLRWALPIAGAFRPFGACNLAGKNLIGTALAGTLFIHFSLALAVTSYFLLLTPHLYWLFTSPFILLTSHFAFTHQMSLP
jgi:hypothetical protein